MNASLYNERDIPMKKEMNRPMNIHSNSILNFIKKEKVITSSELSKKLKISWNTAERHLMNLALERKIERIKKEGVNLWILIK